MNSLRRPHHIRLHDLRNFIHSYDPAMGNTAEEWARQASAGLKQGGLFFLLEPVGAPFGLTSFARKGEDDSFRVTELVLVVRLEDNKAMVLSATNNNYELRFLAALMEEKARKAFLDNRKFSFVLAKPAVQFTANKITEIERLANRYAQGGSRRDFMNDEADPEQEPVVATLAACGARLRWIDSSRQPMDLGSICYLLFTPEGRQQDPNRSQLKANFVPVQQSADGDRRDEAREPAGRVEEAQSTDQASPLEADNVESTSEFLLSSWGQPAPSAEVVANSSLFKRLTDELAKKKPQQDDPLSLLHRSAQSEPAVDVPVLPDANEDKTPKPAVSAKTEGPQTKDEVYHHISEAISELIDIQVDPKQPIEADQSTKWVASQIEAHREEIEQKRGIGKIGQSSVNSMETLPVQEQPAPIAPVPESMAPVDFALIDNVINTGNEPIVFPASDTMPAKLDDFQEPKVVMNEMASLMNKLESQVARAAKKLTASTAAIEQQLTAGMTAMLSIIIQENKDREAQLVIHGDSLSKEFESLFENLKAQLAEKSASAREQTQAKRTGQQEFIEQSEQTHHQTLATTLDQNQAQFRQLVEDKEAQLKNLVKGEAEKLHQQMVDINISLQVIADRFTENLSEQLNNFEKRLDEEITVIVDSLSNNTNMLSKSIVISCQHGLETLKKTKTEFESNLKHLVDTTEIALGRQIRVAQIEFFLPRLKEHKQLIETMMQEMEETFAEKLLNQSQTQLDGLTSSLASARAQLKGLMDQCLNKLDLIGRNQQSGLEELFAAAASSLGQDTDALLRLLKQAEQEITEGDAVCKKLAETYSLDNDPAVTALRQNISNRVDGLKAQVKTELESAVNNDCAMLEDLIRNQHTKLNARRAELAQRVHFASDHGLQRIRAAIHDAFNAIQSERETYME